MRPLIKHLLTINKKSDIQSKSDYFVLSGYFVAFVMQKLGQNNPISTVLDYKRQLKF